MPKMPRIVRTLALLSLPVFGLQLGGSEARAEGWGPGYPGGVGGRVIDPGRPGGRVYLDPGRPGGRLIPGYDPGYPGGRVYIQPHGYSPGRGSSPGWGYRPGSGYSPGRGYPSGGPGYRPYF
jgi:hypothetical protein